MNVRLMGPALALAAAATGLPAQLVPSDSATRVVQEYVLSHYRTPEEYVLGKFASHDVVLLGEFHRIRHDVELVQRLIPLLQQRGIHHLATEFARRVDQPLIDSLLAAPAYDERLARRIGFQQFVYWGFREYIDIFRVVHEVNRAASPGAPKFRIIGINNAPRWELLDADPARRDASRAAVWHGETEEDWAVPILRVVGLGHKVLVHTGMHHAFARYRQPIVVGGKFFRDGDVRLGNHLRAAIGDRAFTISLHSPWSGRCGYDDVLVLPASGAIDTALGRLPSGLHRVGFDLTGTPIGALQDSTSVYSHGRAVFRLADFADGYVVLDAIANYRGVTAIPGWVTDDNLEEVRLGSPNPDLRSRSVDQLNESIVRDADVARRFARALDPTMAATAERCGP